MKKIAWLGLLLPLTVLASSGDYRQQWPLTLSRDDAGAYRVVLDEAVYRAAHRDSLGDIDIFNAQGQALPSALFTAEQPVAQAARKLELPWFPLPARPSDQGGDIRLLAERDANGVVRRIEAQVSGDKEEKAAGEWLIDASRLHEPVIALQLDWSQGQQPLEAAYRVEGSDDLRQWRTLNPRATLVDLSRGGERLQQRRIPLDGSARYLRLVPLQGQVMPALTGVVAELAPPSAVPDWQWRELTGRRVSEQGRDYFEFELDGRFPVDRIDVALPDNSAVEWTVQSRDSAEGAWTYRAGPWMAYRLQGEGQDSRSDAQALSSPVRDRYWRLSARQPVGEALPALRLGYRPEVMVFLAQGQSPYALAAGSARAQRAQVPIPALLGALREQRGAQWQPAPAYLGGDAAPLAGEQALQPAPVERDWKAWLLWALLIGGALIVAGFASSLLRKPPASGDKT